MLQVLGHNIFFIQYFFKNIVVKLNCEPQYCELNLIVNWANHYIV